MRRNPPGYVLAMLLTAAWLCAPIVSVGYPPLIDLPNHLARVEILHRYGAEPMVRQIYVRSIEPIPNLACDILITFLRHFMSLAAAAKTFLVMAQLLFVYGCHRLGRAIHGRSTWLAVLCSFFFYNSMLLFGFLNYVFGFALFTLCLALWLEWRVKWTWVRFIMMTALALAAYLAHLSAYTFLVVTFCAFGAWSYWKDEVPLLSVMASVLPLALPAMTFLAFMEGSGRAGRLHWDTVAGKAITLLPLFLSYDRWFDAVFLALLGVVLAMLLLNRRHVAFHRPALAAALLLLGCYLVSPTEALTGSGVDARFVPPAILLLVLSLRVEMPRARARRVLIACVAVAALRVGLVWSNWMILDRRIGAEAARLLEVPEGASIYPVFVQPHDGPQAKAARAIRHVIHYAGIGRHAVVPTLFSYPSQQPISFRAALPYAEPPDNFAEQWLQSSATWVPYLEAYDYVWSYGADEPLMKVLRSNCELVYENDGFMLCQLRHGGG
jgi:hypothetical protein